MKFNNNKTVCKYKQRMLCKSFCKYREYSIYVGIRNGLSVEYASIHHKMNTNYYRIGKKDAKDAKDVNDAGAKSTRLWPTRKTVSQTTSIIICNASVQLILLQSHIHIRFFFLTNRYKYIYIRFFRIYIYRPVYLL